VLFPLSWLVLLLLKISIAISMGAALAQHEADSLLILTQILMEAPLEQSEERALIFIQIPMEAPLERSEVSE